MESLNHNSSNIRSLVEEDANISTFRRRNKIVILVLLFLIISLTLITATLIISLVHIHDNTSQSYISPLEAYCYVSDKESCLQLLNPIISTRFIADPNPIFTVSLQTVAENLQRIISTLSRSNSAFKNCSNALRDGLDQIQDPLATMRVNPFVETLSNEQRGDMMNRIIAAEDDLMSCIDILAKVNESTKGVGTVRAKLLDLKVYLNSAGDFLIGYAEVLQMYEADNGVDRGIIFEKIFGICMCGLQLAFMFCLFWSVFRTR